ncbi:hypothetical protein AM228_28130 [Planktothricoides sp. SR001]|nr:lysylphosphatidylglycerol synthase domain-containing protein [Planktothricoides sp. SR001]KOR33731.1 hypothetical protein AM228_28130 [Planktothricoides sp. SR001]
MLGKIKIFSKYVRWLIFGAGLFFLIITFKQHALEVGSLKITALGWVDLGLSLIVTLLAHIWSGWVWTWILREFNQPVPVFWALRIYLTTNMAKYIPGNVWHFYGRILTINQIGVPGNVATVSVLLEPLLMAAAALIMALLGSFAPLQNTSAHGLEIGAYKFSQTVIQIGKILGLTGVLLGVHPVILNPLVKFLGKGKLKNQRKKHHPAPKFTRKITAESDKDSLNSLRLEPGQLQRYPLVPLIGELGFLWLRGSGFLLAMLAMLQPLDSFNLSTLMKSGFLVLSAFSFAWLLGLVLPGAPGGIGIFEATAIALLQNNFPPGILLGAIAFYRLISLAAEAIGGASAWLIEKYPRD